MLPADAVVSAFYDGIIYAALSLAAAMRTKDRILQDLAEAGFIVKDNKVSAVSQVVLWIGFELDLGAGRLRVGKPRARICTECKRTLVLWRKAMAQARAAGLDQCLVKTARLRRVLGLLGFAAVVFNALRAVYRPLLLCVPEESREQWSKRQRHERFAGPKEVLISEEALRALEDSLELWQLVGAPLNPSSIETPIDVWTDASGLGGWELACDGLSIRAAGTFPFELRLESTHLSRYWRLSRRSMRTASP